MGKKDKKDNVEKKKFSFISLIIYLFLILGIIYIYARYIGTTGIKVNEYSIASETIPESFDGFSIVHFSDLELGSTFNVENLDSLVDKINDLNPDIVVFTGDIVSKYKKLTEDDLNKLTDAFTRIEPLIGKYSVRGDDDTKGNIYEEVTTKSGFMDITNSYELIYYKGLTPIVLYGLDSLISGHQDYESTFSYPSKEDDPKYMATYRILLAHEPDTIDNISEYNISLMLSGHSHNSELNVPYIKTLYKIDGAKKYYDPEYKVGNTKLFVSGGLGTSKYKVRLLSRPSISVYKLYTK